MFFVSVSTPSHPLSIGIHGYNPHNPKMHFRGGKRVVTTVFQTCPEDVDRRNGTNVVPTGMRSNLNDIPDGRSVLPADQFRPRVGRESKNACDRSVICASKGPDYKHRIGEGFLKNNTWKTCDLLSHFYPTINVSYAHFKLLILMYVQT